MMKINCRKIEDIFLSEVDAQRDCENSEMKGLQGQETDTCLLSERFFRHHNQTRTSGGVVRGNHGRCRR